MPLFRFLLAVQCFSIVLLLLECAYITKKWSKPLHGWLFFYCVSVLINNAGYLGFLMARTEGESVLCWQFSYLGKSWTGFSLLMFILMLCRGTTYSRISTIFTIPSIVTYFSVLTMRHNRLYYKSFTFTEEGLFPHLVFQHGPWHYVYDFTLVLFMLVGFTVLFQSLCKPHDRHKRPQILLITLATVTDSIFCLMQIFKLVTIYDMNVVGFTISSVLLFIAMFFYDILDSRELAREFVLENISEGIVVTSEKGSLVTSNGKGRKLLESLSRDPEAAMEKMRSLLSEGKPLRDGEEVFSIKEEQLRNKKGVAGRVYLLTDETEHYRYIDELKEQKLIADKANHAKGDFLSNMSHEIRTPINAVLGLDEMILREADDEAILGYAHDIQSSGRSLLSLINDILDFSKIEAGKMEIVSAEYELAVMVGDLVNMTASRAEAKNLLFSVQVDPDTPHLLFGDDTRIKQCVLNLLTNAVKYTPSGSVWLSVRGEKKDETHVLLTVSVRDTGIGIKEEDLKKLFSPFERIEEKRNRSIEGTGLGMSIVKNLLAAMGTHLDVRSEYGKGSEFSFAVEQEVRSWEGIGDWEKSKSLVTSSSGYREPFQAPEARILVVDDTPMNITVFKGLLKQTRIQVDTASDGEAGLAVSRSRPYNVIFIDHLMPRMDGLQMLAAIRTDDTNVNKDTPCIALTANAIGGAKDMYIAAGFSDYLSKPINSKLLEALLANFIPKDLQLHKGDAGFVEREIRSKATGTGSPAAPDPAGGILQALFSLNGEHAARNCGGDEIFLSAVRSFYDAIEEKAALIRTLLEAGDWKNYTVQVHALKSSARLVGASALSEMARYLEECGNKMQQGDESARGDIEALTPGLLADYMSYHERLAPFVTA
ncbi:MAG: response regulator [Treponema sp.]|nr:response regulator [Treponema sp.]